MKAANVDQSDRRRVCGVISGAAEVLGLSSCTSASRTDEKDGHERHRKNIESVQHVESDAECDHGQLKGRDPALCEPALQVLAQGVARRLTLKRPTRL
jgi:hypothetical protein